MDEIDLAYEESMEQLDQFLDLGLRTAEGGVGEVLCKILLAVF